MFERERDVPDVYHAGCTDRRLSGNAAILIVLVAFGGNGGFAKTVEPVADAHHGMLPGHPWPGIAHHRLDSFLPVAPVAMHRTIGAGWLLHAEVAAVQSQSRVVQQRLALAAQSGPP